jgi:hypothetical protein
VDDASFCRGCGANVSLVPQALEGRAPELIVEGKRGRSDRHKRDEPPNLTFALVKTFVGIAFILVALAVKDVIQISGHLWWFWMLIPAAGSLGSGIAEFVRLYQQSNRTQPAALAGSSSSAYVPPAVAAPPPARAGELPPRRERVDIYTPSSVTENTTKLLDKDQ